MIATAILIGASLVAGGLILLAFSVFTLAESLPVKEHDL